MGKSSPLRGTRLRSPGKATGRTRGDISTSMKSLNAPLLTDAPVFVCVDTPYSPGTRTYLVKRWMFFGLATPLV